MDLSTLPIEMLEAISSELDLPIDLFHLALTCSRLASVVIPRHLYYRVIQCSIESGSQLWEALTKDRNLAQNVRTLELNRPSARLSRGAIQVARLRGTHPPFVSIVDSLDTLPGVKWVGSALDLEPRTDAAERSFRGALRNMNHLVRFQWGPENPGRAMVDNSTEADDIWHILSAISTLRHVNIVDDQTLEGVDVTPIQQSAVS